MKLLNFISAMIVLTLFATSCKKEGTHAQQLSSINVVNASVGLATAQINYLGTNIIYATYTANVAFGANAVYPLKTGPSSISVVSKADTTKAVYTSSLSTGPGDIYTLYLAGQSTAVDAIVLKDTLAFHSATDSVVGVRFINLSYNSAPFNVTLSTSTTVNEFSGISYKAITAFKYYPALIANTLYTFQVRDAGGVLLTTYSLSVPRFLNVTLALKGMVGGIGANALGVMRINNY